LSDSFFTSAAWFEPYLKFWPQGETERIYIDSQFVESGFLVIHKAQLRSRFQIKYRAFGINQSLAQHLLDVTLEQNGPLGAGAVAAADWIKSAFTNFDDRDDWDELVFSAVEDPAFSAIESEAKQRGWFVADHIVHPCFSTRLPQTQVDAASHILASFSANSRARIRRAMRKVEHDFGQLKIRTATTPDQVSDWLKQLASWHARRWAEKSDAGGFTNPVFFEFQLQLALHNLQTQHLRMHCVSAGDTALGYLMNFRWKSTELAYVGAYNYDQANAYWPGLLTHFLAMSHAAESGAQKYDFLKGYSRYKESFSNEKSQLHSLRVRRTRALFRLEKSLKTIKQAITN
jgi:hypothetical protein